MLKIFNHLERTRRERVPSRFGRTEVTRKVEVPNEMAPLEDRFVYEYQVRVFCRTVGPSFETEPMVDRARRMIARELYGPVQSDLIRLREMLWEEEHYRPPGDPVLTLIDDMLRKMRGEEVSHESAP